MSTMGSPILIVSTCMGKSISLQRVHNEIAPLDKLGIKVHNLTLCIRETPKMSTFANREDPDEMQHNAAFHLGLHCL